MDILKRIAPVIPSAAQALKDIETDTITPAWQRETRIGKMLDNTMPKSAPSGMTYLNRLMMDEAQKKYDSHVSSIDTRTKQQQFASSLESGGMLGKAAGGLVRTAEYIASPIAAASGLIQKAILPNDLEGRSRDVQELPQNAAMARTSLPLTVGLATLPLGVGAGALATGVAGVAGRGLQETAESVTDQNTQSFAGRAGESLFEGAVTGLTDLAAGKILKYGGNVIKSLSSPLAGRFNTEVAELAARKGMKLPVSSMSDSNVVKQIETLGQKGLFGGEIENMVSEASSKLGSLADDLVQKLGGSDDLTIAGKSVIEGADAYRESWRALKNKAYAFADEALAKGDAGSFIPDTANTQSVIVDILSGKEAATGLLGDLPMTDTTTGILQTLYKNLQARTTLPLNAYTSTLDELNRLTKFGNTLISTGDQAILKKVIASLDEDVTKGIESIAPSAAKALRKADDIYIKGIKLLDSTFGDKIAKLADNPTKIVDQLITSNSVDDVPRIFELISKGKDGAKRVADVRSAFTRKLLRNATGETGIIGNKLDRAINSYGQSTVKAVLGDDAYGALQEITKLAKAVDIGQSVAKGSQTTFTGKAAALVTAVASGNVPLAASIIGGDKILSKLLGTQWFRNWLTKGYAVPAIAETAGMIGSEILERGAVSGAQQLIPTE